MSGTNDFLPFGTAVGANVVNQATWSGLSARTAGFSAGEAVSAQLNKAWRQSSTMAAVLGKIISDANLNAVDDGDVSTLSTNLLTALAKLLVITPPAGTICYYAAGTVPPGRWVAGDGQVVNRAGTYADLFAIIGTTYNTGGESGTQFRLPDLRGVVVRGQDAGRGLDPSRVLGSYQADQNKAHYHLLPQVGDSSCINQYLYGSTDISPTQIATLDNKSSNTSEAARTSSGAESGGTEVRVKSIALRGYISY